MSDFHESICVLFLAMKLTIIGLNDDQTEKCEAKINRYLKRCSTFIKLEHPNGVFYGWDQRTIIDFYEECTNLGVLPNIDSKEKCIELTGSVTSMNYLRQKWTLVCELAACQFNDMLTKPRPSSARSSLEVSRNNRKIYNILVSFCDRDANRCQRIIDGLAKEKFCIWAEPLGIDQERNVVAEMQKSDCIIICISENYYDTFSSQKETKYALESGQPIFFVKLGNEPLIGWQRALSHDNIFYHLFGSNNWFKLQFTGLLIEIVSTSIVPVIIKLTIYLFS